MKINELLTLIFKYWGTL